MKLRNPKEFSAAITRVRAALGEEGCARAVGRSDSLVRKWADPDHPAVPNLDQALSLDAAYVAAGHGDAPILGLYQDLIENGIKTSRIDVRALGNKTTSGSPDRVDVKVVER